MKVVIDTNVLVSALLNAQSLPAQFFNLVLNGKLQMLYTNTIVSEYSNVLYRRKFGFPPELIEPVLDLIQHQGELGPVNTKKQFMSYSSYGDNQRTICHHRRSLAGPAGKCETLKSQCPQRNFVRCRTGL